MHSRMDAVQAPIIPIVGELIRRNPGTISLGQGMVSWGPPPAADRRGAGGRRPRWPSHRYGPVEGSPELVAALGRKLRAENGLDLDGSRVLVTAGSNMAFLSVVQAITSTGDEIVLPAPFYFNHEMAVRMAGCVPVIVPTDAQYQIDPDALAPRDHTADARDRDGLPEQPDRRRLSRGGAARGERAVRRARAAAHLGRGLRVLHLGRRPRTSRPARCPVRARTRSRCTRCRRPTASPDGASATW